jgi:hypothetical protein
MTDTGMDMMWRRPVLTATTDTPRMHAPPMVTTVRTGSLAACLSAPVPGSAVDFTAAASTGVVSTAEATMVAADTTVEATVADITAADAEFMAAARLVIHAASSAAARVVEPLAASAVERVVVSTAAVAECMAVVDTDKIESS